MTSTIATLDTEFVEVVNGTRYLMDRVGDDGHSSYVGKILTDEHGEYFGCIVCDDQIEREDAGCCSACRADLAADEMAMAVPA